LNVFSPSFDPAARATGVKVGATIPAAAATAIRLMMPRRLTELVCETPMSKPPNVQFTDMLICSRCQYNRYECLADSSFYQSLFAERQ
jgi:hypothetical protein